MHKTTNIKKYCALKTVMLSKTKAAAPRKKPNVLTLRAGPNEMNRRKRRAKLNISEDSEDIDDIIDIVDAKAHALKRVLEITGGTEIEVEHVDAINPNNIFSYGENNVIAIVDRNRKIWCKAKDIAIIFGYSRTKIAISRNISPKYKKSFAVIRGQCDGTLPKLDPQTIFIDQTGILQFIMKGNKRECEKFSEWLSEEVIPALMNTGHYEMPITDSDIKQLTKSFYDNNDLSNYMDSPCIYLAYVGKHKVIIDGKEVIKHIIKYGNTTQIDERDLNQHRKFFPIFNILGIWKTLAHLKVEKRIEKNFRCKNMLVDLKIKGLTGTKEVNRREHVVLTQNHGLEYCLSMIENLVNTITLPQMDEHIKEIASRDVTIKSLNDKIESLDRDIASHIREKATLERCIKLHEDNATTYKTTIQSLKNKIVKIRKAQ